MYHFNNLTMGPIIVSKKLEMSSVGNYKQKHYCLAWDITRASWVIVDDIVSSKLQKLFGDDILNSFQNTIKHKVPLILQEFRLQE